MTSRLVQFVDAPRFQSFAQLFLGLWRKEHLPRAGAGFSIRCAPHINSDWGNSCTVSVDFLSNTFVARCNHPDRTLGCSNSAEPYISSQSCPLAENLAAPGNQGNHRGHFDWTAVRSLHIDVHVGRRVVACMS